MSSNGNSGSGSKGGSNTNIQEGTIKKGGINYAPATSRPVPPSGQIGSGSSGQESSGTGSQDSSGASNQGGSGNGNEGGSATSNE